MPIANGFSKVPMPSGGDSLTLGFTHSAVLGMKVPGFRFDGRMSSSKSKARKAASAMIAKIPRPVTDHLARMFDPRRT